MKSIFQNKTLTIVIIFLLLANLGLLAYYSFFKPASPHGRKRPVTEFVKTDLGFDEKQMKSWEEIRLKNKERLKQLFEESAAAKDSFYQLVLTENLDDSILFDRALIVADKQRAIEMEFFRQFRGIQAMCKPEQLPKFDASFMPMVRKLFRQQKHDSDSTGKK